MSYLDAVNNSAIVSLVNECLAAGAVLIAGQFGATVCQYHDHYVRRTGLVSESNPGIYKPIPTFKGRAPDQNGTLIGEYIVSQDGKRYFAWTGEQWVEF